MTGNLSRLFVLVALGILVMASAGCSTTEPENQSERPWNTRQSWEGGFPASINEGR